MSDKKKKKRMGITALNYTIAVCEGRCEKIDFIKGKRTSFQIPFHLTISVSSCEELQWSAGLVSVSNTSVYNTAGRMNKVCGIEIGGK